MNEQTVTAVFDCMIFVQATARKRGPAAACLRLVEGGEAALFVSEPILAEIQEVLSRPVLRRKNFQITDETIEGVLRFLTTHAVSLKDVPQHVSLQRDPDDEKYVNLALAAGARYVVSRDNDMLSLMNDLDFRSRFPQLSIVDPVEFLRIVRTTDDTHEE